MSAAPDAAAIAESAAAFSGQKSLLGDILARHAGYFRDADWSIGPDGIVDLRNGVLGIQIDCSPTLWNKNKAYISVYFGQHRDDLAATPNGALLHPDRAILLVGRPITVNPTNFTRADDPPGWESDGRYQLDFSELENVIDQARNEIWRNRLSAYMMFRDGENRWLNRRWSYVIDNARNMLHMSTRILSQNDLLDPDKLTPPQLKVGKLFRRVDEAINRRLAAAHKIFHDGMSLDLPLPEGFAESTGAARAHFLDNVIPLGQVVPDHLKRSQRLSKRQGPITTEERKTIRRYRAGDWTIHKMGFFLALLGKNAEEVTRTLINKLVPAIKSGSALALVLNLVTGFSRSRSVPTVNSSLMFLVKKNMRRVGLYPFTIEAPVNNLFLDVDVDAVKHFKIPASSLTNHLLRSTRMHLHVPKILRRVLGFKTGDKASRIFSFYPRRFRQKLRTRGVMHNPRFLNADYDDFEVKRPEGYQPPGREELFDRYLRSRFLAPNKDGAAFQRIGIDGSYLRLAERKRAALRHVSFGDGLQALQNMKTHEVYFFMTPADDNVKPERLLPYDAANFLKPGMVRVMKDIKGAVPETTEISHDTFVKIIADLAGDRFAANLPQAAAPRADRMYEPAQPQPLLPSRLERGRYIVDGVIGKAGTVIPVPV